MSALQALRSLEDHGGDSPTERHGLYFVAKDAAGPVRALSSDVLQSLYFLNPGACVAAMMRQFIALTVTVLSFRSRR